MAPVSKKPTRRPPASCRVPKRLVMLSVPKRQVVVSDANVPAWTEFGVRKSAINAVCSDRVADVSWPYMRKILNTKRVYRNKFNEERLDKINRMIEAVNTTIYMKLANCALDLKKQEMKKKRGWTESEWKKHMDYISQIAEPKQDFRRKNIPRGKWKPLDQLLPRINRICYMPDFKVYRRLSEEPWYRNPVKVPPNALKYVITDRVKKLAEHRVIPLSY